MKKAIRIGYNQYYNDEVFAKHLDYIKRNADVIDELTLFAEFCHYGYWSEEYSKENAEIIADRINQYKKVGIKRVGINLLNTVGHKEEGLDVLPLSPLQYQVNFDGKVSRSILCPSNKAFLEHTKKRYAIYAQTGADFIWVDDDLRFTNHGLVNEFCYCPHCIKEFNSINGTHLSREELADKVVSDAEITKKWTDFKTFVTKRWIKAAEIGVKETNSNIEFGLMFCGTDKEYVKLVEDSSVTMIRPGGGYYNDQRPIDVVTKAHRVQGEIMDMAKFNFSNIQYEYEAFNYQQLERSQHISEVETSMALMNGCNGVLYNDNMFGDNESTTDMLRKSKEKWQVLTEINKGCTNAGVYCHRYTDSATILNELSIPVTTYMDKACCVMMLGDEWNLYDDETVKILLDKNVLTDGKGVEILARRGFGDLCGGKIKKIHKNSMAERFTEHDLNGNYKNYYRDVFMNFFYDADAYEFEPDAEAEIISNMETITHKPLGCSAYIYKNKFAADGYLMLHSSKTYAKREQIGNILDKLSCNSLPVRIANPIKVAPMVTTDEKGTMNIMLTNISFDKTGVFECVVRNTKPFSIITDDGKLVPAKQVIDGDESIITIDNLDAWNYILLTNK